MRKAFNLFTRLMLVRYFAASIGALAVDMGSFLALLELGIPAAPAAAMGYAVGIVAHWLFSSRAVFSDSVAAHGPQRTRQKAMFVVSALLGLSLTTLIVGTGAALGLDPRLAKLFAIGASFTLTWLLRSRIIFVNPDPA